MLLQELGADECIDYRQADFRQQLESKPVDVVVDSVGGELWGYHPPVPCGGDFRQTR